MIYKLLLPLLLLGIVFEGNAQESTPQAADKIIEEAVENAAEAHKNVFILFHASWCGWCHKMDAAMNDPLCKQLFEDHYVIRHLTILESEDKKDQENPGAELVYRKYAPENSGIPFWLIYDGSGKEVADAKMPDGNNSGCPAAEAEVAHFIEVLKKTSTLKENELKIIYDRFRQNDPAVAHKDTKSVK